MGKFSRAVLRVQQRVKAKAQYDALKAEEKAKAEIEGLKREEQVYKKQMEAAKKKEQVKELKKKVRGKKYANATSYFKGMGITVNTKPQSPFASNRRRGGGLGPSQMMIPSHMRGKRRK